MKLPGPFWGGMLAAAVAANAVGQEVFHNLNFESPVLPLVHVSSGGFDFVASSNAVPGWTLFLGAKQQSRVLFNNYFLGTATIGLLGPGLTNLFPTFPRIIDGGYTLTLQAGADPLIAVNPPFVDAAMTQSSLVPVSARLLQLKAYPVLGANAQSAVSFNGQLVNMLPLTNTANYTLFGGDITAFAGLHAELRITALATPTYPFSAFAFDSIAFVPEPGMFALIGLGALFFGWRFFSKPRS